MRELRYLGPGEDGHVIVETLDGGKQFNLGVNDQHVKVESNARATVRLDDVPTKAPAFTSLKVDGAGYLWARRLIGSDSIRTTFDVFAPAGAWLGGLTMPVAVPEYGGHVITAGDFYTRAEDDDGRPVVIRFRIIR